MEYIIAGLLFANIAVCIFKKNLLQIKFDLTLTHKYDMPEAAPVDEKTEQDNLKEMKSVIEVFNEYISKGGLMDD